MIGISDSKLAIHGKGNKTYQDVQFDDAKLVEALLVLKPKEIADQLFFVMERGRQLCNRGTLEIWSEHAKIFHRNSSLCSNPNNDLKTAFNFQDTALLYFKSTVSQLKELKIWFYSSNKGKVSKGVLLPPPVSHKLSADSYPTEYVLRQKEKTIHI